jgi:hypothetical protein
MWNLSGDDISRAKEELKGRRAAIKAHYDKEMKQLEADIAAIESFERAAVDFVSNFKGEHEASATGTGRRTGLDCQHPRPQHPGRGRCPQRAGPGGRRL